MSTKNVADLSGEKNGLGMKFVDPEKVISQLEIGAEDIVAEFGCGTGYFVFPVAKRIQGAGQVYALDILKEKLETVESQAKLSGLTNVIIQRANLEKALGSGLSDESVNLVIIADMLFQNKDKESIVSEAKRILKPKGKMLIIEWAPQNITVGPARNVRISKEAVVGMAQKFSFSLEKEIPVSDFHYGLIFVK